MKTNNQDDEVESGHRDALLRALAKNAASARRDGQGADSEAIYALSLLEEFHLTSIIDEADEEPATMDMEQLVAIVRQFADSISLEQATEIAESPLLRIEQKLQLQRIREIAREVVTEQGGGAERGIDSDGEHMTDACEAVTRLRARLEKARQGR